MVYSLRKDIIHLNIDQGKKSCTKKRRRKKIQNFRTKKQGENMEKDHTKKTKKNMCSTGKITVLLQFEESKEKFPKHVDEILHKKDVKEKNIE